MNHRPHGCLQILCALLPILGLLLAARLLRENPLVDARARHLVTESRRLADTFEHDAAIGYMQEALRVAPQRADLYVELGRRISLIYEWDRAIAAYDRAQALSPDYADTYYFRGLLYASAPSVDAREQAIADFQRYLSLAPDGAFASAASRNLEVLLAQQDALTDGL